MKLPTEKLAEIEGMKNEVGEFLLQICQAANKEASQIGAVDLPIYEDTDNEEFVGVSVDDVKGFDLGRDIRRRIK